MSKRTTQKRPSLNSFARGYIEATLWSSTDEDEQPLDRDHSVSDIATPTLRKMVADCLRFQRVARADLNEADISSAEAGALLLAEPQRTRDRLLGPRPRRRGRPAPRQGQAFR